MADALIASEWRDSAAKTLPDDLSPAELAEARQAFFCGAAAVFCKVAESIAGKPGAPDAATLLNGVQAELLAEYEAWKREETVH